MTPIPASMQSAAARVLELGRVEAAARSVSWAAQETGHTAAILDRIRGALLDNPSLADELAPVLESMRRQSRDLNILAWEMAAKAGVPQL